METFKSGSHPRPVISQAENNTTLWIGHLQSDPTDHFGGQTFTCPSDGQLDNIQLWCFSNPISRRYPINPSWIWSRNKNVGTFSWWIITGGKKRWSWKMDPLSFTITPIKQSRYGFRVNTSNAMIGLGEAVCHNQNPHLATSRNGDSINQRGHYYSYFSLAFKVELRLK